MLPSVVKNFQETHLKLTFVCLFVCFVCFSVALSTYKIIPRRAGFVNTLFQIFLIFLDFFVRAPFRSRKAVPGETHIWYGMDNPARLRYEIWVVRIDTRYRGGLLFGEKDPHLQAHLIPDNVTVGIADPVKADEG